MRSPVEPLESRQLLATTIIEIPDARGRFIRDVVVVDSGGQFIRDPRIFGNANLIGTFLGTFSAQRASGGTRRLDTRFDFFEQSRLGGADGLATVETAGAMEISGTVLNRKVNLLFSGRSAGTFIGTLSRNGERLLGRMRISINNVLHTGVADLRLRPQPVAGFPDPIVRGDLDRDNDGIIDRIPRVIRRVDSFVPPQGVSPPNPFKFTIGDNRFNSFGTSPISLFGNSVFPGGAPTSWFGSGAGMFRR